MKGFAASVLGALGLFGVMAIGLTVLGFYAVAFRVGAEEWFGWEGWWVAAIFVVGVFVFRSGLILMVAMVVGGYGAYYEWDWPLWVVVPVFFPMIAFMLAAVLFTALGTIFERARV